MSSQFSEVRFSSVAAATRYRGIRSRVVFRISKGTFTLTDNLVVGIGFRKHEVGTIESV